MRWCSEHVCVIPAELLRTRAEMSPMFPKRARNDFVAGPRDFVEPLRQSTYNARAREEEDSGEVYR